MRHSFRSTGLCAALITGAFLACSDVNSEPVGVEATEVAFDQTDKLKAKGLHSAIVNSDGTLMGGTAISATHNSEGSYTIDFGESVLGCAGSANSATFPGYIRNALTAVIRLDIGDTEPTHVRAVIQDPLGLQDTSFTLTLVCM
jgi:hypothetical protein